LDKEQAATNVPDNKQAVIDNNRSQLINIIKNSLENLSKELTDIKTDITLIKPVITELTGIKKEVETLKEEIKTLFYNKETFDLFAGIEHNIKILVTNAEKQDSIPYAVKNIETLLNSVTSRFDVFSKLFQDSIGKQEKFVQQVDAVTNRLSVPGINSTWVNRILKRLKSVITVVAWMLIGIGLLRLGEFLWVLSQNQN